MNLIELYLKYNNNIEEYEEMFHKPFQNLIADINNMLNQSSMDELIKFYYKYSYMHYLTNYSVNNLLNLIYNKIIKKIENVDLADLIDIYAELFDKIMEVESSIESSKNIARIRSYNLNNDSFLELQSNLLHTSIDKLREKYQYELENFENSINTHIKTFNYLDELQAFIFEYLEQKIMMLSNNETEDLIRKLNYQIEKLNTTIVRRKELLTNQVAFNIEARMNGLIVSNLYYEDLKNKLYVYQNYQFLLAKKIDKKLNK